jgi:hypothetical protein
VGAKVAVLVAKEVEVGIGVKVPGRRMGLGVAVGVGEMTAGNVGGIRAVSSGANM